MVEDKVNAWSYQAPKTECRKSDAILEPTGATVLRPEYSCKRSKTHVCGCVWVCVGVYGCMWVCVCVQHQNILFSGALLST